MTTHKNGFCFTNGRRKNQVRRRERALREVDQVTIYHWHFLAGCAKNKHTAIYLARRRCPTCIYTCSFRGLHSWTPKVSQNYWLTPRSIESNTWNKALKKFAALAETSVKACYCTVAVKSLISSPRRVVYEREYHTQHGRIFTKPAYFGTVFQKYCRSTLCLQWKYWPVRHAQLNCNILNEKLYTPWLCWNYIKPARAFKQVSSHVREARFCTPKTIPPQFNVENYTGHRHSLSVWSNHCSPLYGTILHMVPVGGLHARILFSSNKNHSTTNPIVTSYIKHFICGIFPFQGRIVAFHSCPGTTQSKCTYVSGLVLSWRELSAFWFGSYCVLGAGFYSKESLFFAQWFSILCRLN